MLHDSMDVGVLAENVRLLQKEIEKAGSELPTPEAGDVGKILKVGSEGYELATEYSYTPPAYVSEGETNTGVKWTDDKDIYKKIIAGTTPTESGTATIATLTGFDTIVCWYGTIGDTIIHEIERSLDINFSYASGKMAAAFSGSTLNVPYKLIIEYTKSTPSALTSPAPDNDTRSVESIEEVNEEPIEEVKTTRKRSTSSK